MAQYERTDLLVRPVETDDELRLANDLMAKSQRGDYFADFHWLETCGNGYPSYCREHTRLALHNNDLAGVLRINSETIRLGEARLKMGGFGWVATAPRHRQKGVCRILMQETLTYLRHRGYHVSMLFGIPNFYHRFGFATTLADYAIGIDLEDATESLPCPFRVRDGKPGDIRVLQRLHAANDADIACSLVRTSAHFTNLWDRCCKGLRVLTNGQGKVLAYFLARNENAQLTVTEVGIAEPSLCEAVLAACARAAADAAVGRIQFLLPPPHPMARFLLLHKSSHQMRVERNAGGMMAIINLGETLETLIPEWESLIARSVLRDERVEFTLLVNGEHHRVRANRGAIDIAQIPGKNKLSVTPVDLMHIITGYRYVEDILDAQRRLITEEARALITTLFPKRTPYFWKFDRF